MADPTFSLDPDDYDDVDIDDAENPELTKEDFANARPLMEVMPELFARLVAETSVELHLSADTILAFAEQGDDWRERMAETLNQAAIASRVAQDA